MKTVTNCIPTFFTSVTVNSSVSAWDYSSVYTHLLNSVYTLAALVFSAKPVRLVHVYQPVVYGVIYVIFSVLYHAAGGDAIYPVLDWNKPESAVMTALLIPLIGIPIMHLAIFALYTLRLYVAGKMNCKTAPEKETMEREVTSRDVDLELAFKDPTPNNNTMSE